MKRFIKLLLLILCMTMIFFFSSQASQDSSVSTSFVVRIFYDIYKFMFSKTVLTIEQFSELYYMPIRKLAHFSEFGLLGVLMYINLSDYMKSKYVVTSLVLSIIYAISDEIHQYFVPGRFCSIKDMFIDSCGIVVGIFLIHIVYKKCKRNI